MRRIVILVPDLLGEPSVLRQKLPSLQQMAEMGDLVKLQPLPDVDTREALYLGMRPDEGQLRQGPLTVSTLGADPPGRSTHPSCWPQLSRRRLIHTSPGQLLSKLA